MSTDEVPNTSPAASAIDAEWPELLAPEILGRIDERRNLLEMDVRIGKNGGGRFDVLIVQPIY
jgi:hypothetical protein